MTELYIFNQDDKPLTIITEDTGLVSAPVRIELNSVPDTPFSFTVESDAENAEHIKEENKVVYRDHEGDLRLVVIKELDDSDSINGPETTAVCEPDFSELRENIVVDRRFNDRTAQYMLDAALENTRYIGEVEVDLGLGSTNFYYIDSVTAIWKIIEIMGGEFKDVVEFDENNNIIARKIKLVQRLGADTGQRFEIDHNIKEIGRTVLSYPITAMYGRGSSLPIEDDEGEQTGGHTRYIDFADVEWKKSNGDPVDKPLGQKWVGDQQSLQIYGRPHNGELLHREGIFSNQDYEDPKELLWATWQNLQVNKYPEVNYRLSVDLFDDKVSLGDTAIAIDRYFARPIEIQTRVIAMEYDLLDIEDTMIIEMGQFLNLGNEISDLKEEIENIKSNPPRQHIDIDSYPNRKPPTPVNVRTEGGFSAIYVYWDVSEFFWLKHYEVYGSQVADFVPDSQHLLWRGDVSAFAHTVKTDETWYYYVRAVNYHGTASEWSVRVSASTVRIISDDILFGEEIAEELRRLSETSKILADNSITGDLLGEDVTTEINTARSRADEAHANANLATQNATDAINQAQTSFDKAQEALTESATAILNSENALLESGTAKSIADTANGIASDAYNRATTAGNNASQALQDAQSALSNFEGLRSEFENLEIGGRNYFSPNRLTSMVFGGSPGNAVIVSGSSYKGFHIKVNEGEVYSLSRDSKINNRFEYGFTVDEPESGMEVHGWVRDRTNEPLKFEGIVVPEGMNYLLLYLTNQNDDLPNIMLVKGTKATDWQPAPEDIFSEIDKKADGSTVYTISEIDGMIDNTVSIERYTTDIDGILTDIESHSTKISQNEEAIGLRATTDDLDAVNQTLTNRIGSVEVKADSVITSVGEIRTEFDELSYENRNLLKGTMELTSDYFYRYASVSLSQDEEIPYITSTGSSADYEIMEVEPNQTYTLSIDIRNFIEGNNGAILLQWFNSLDGSRVNFVWSDMNTSEIGTDWKRFQITFTVPSNISFFSLGLRWADFRLPKLEKGTRATPYSIAPEDTDSRINSITSNLSELTVDLNGIAQTVSNIESTTDNITSRLAEVETTADGITQTVSRVRADLDGLEYENRNLIQLENSSEVVGDAFVTIENLSGKEFVLSIHNEAYKGQYDVSYTAMNNDVIVSLGTIESFDEPFYFSEEEEVTIFIIRVFGMSLETFKEAKFKFEKGNKVTDWNIAPEDVEVQFSQITQTIDTFGVLINDNNEAIGQLQVTATDFVGRFDNLEGDVGSLTLTAQGLQNRISDAEGNINTFTQVASTLQASLEDAEGNINELTLTAQLLDSRISDVVYNKNKLPGMELGHISLINGEDSPSTTRLRSPLIEIEPEATYTFSVDGTSQLVYWYEYGFDGQFLKYTGQRSSLSVSGDTRYIRVMKMSDSDTTQNFQIEGGSTATDYVRHFGSASQSQITQLANNINLRVEIGDVINQINLDASGALIAGENIILDGNVTVTDLFKVGEAHITNAAIGTAHIQNGAITRAKLERAIIGTAQIEDAAITNAKIHSLNADKINAGTLSAITANLGNVTGGRITQQSSGGRIEMYDGRVQSYRGSNLALEIANYKMRFYNSDRSEIGSIYPIASLTTEEKGMGIEVSNDSYLGVGISQNGILYPSLAILPFSSRTYLAGPYSSGILTSSLELYANRQFLSFESNISSIDQPAIIMRQGISENNMLQYFGGYARRNGAVWQVRYRESESSSIRRIEANSAGVVIQGTLSHSSGYEYYMNGSGNGNLTGANTLVAGGVRTIDGNDNFFVGVNNELRVTSKTGSSGTTYYRDIRARELIETSSRQYKTNITPMESSALAEINKLSIVNFNLVDDLNNGIDDLKTGLIAEDSPYFATDDNMAIRINKLLMYGIKSIQEVDKKYTDEITWLKTENQLQANKIKILEHRIEQLEDKVA